VSGLAVLALTAAAVGALHSVAPDHWVPFAALARARRWSTAHTARITILCGLGHVTVSAVLGVLALITGLRAVHAIGIRLEEHATLLLMGFGTVYMVWGLRRSFRRDPLAVLHDHHHHHARGHNDHDHGLTEWSLFTLFSLDPCVAVIPMIVAATAGGWAAVGGVVLVYEAATIAAMMLLVGVAVAGVRTMRFAFLDRFGDALAGGLILTTGGVLAVLGL
jgi:nickel/cobalt transporter (NicO) family protein